MENAISVSAEDFLRANGWNKVEGGWRKFGQRFRYMPARDAKSAIRLEQILEDVKLHNEEVESLKKANIEILNAGKKGR